jgi:hypothetical protein
LESREEEVAGLSADLLTAEELVASLENQAKAHGIEKASLEDQCENLTAQLEHLRADRNRLSGELKRARKAYAESESDLEEAREQWLLATHRPRELEAELKVKTALLEELESQLDVLAQGESSAPRFAELVGTSSDGRAFAITGLPLDAADLPMEIYLCQRDSILLEGWIDRSHEDHLIGHTHRWLKAPSTLVKAEKVFILPKHNEAEVP